MPQVTITPEVLAGISGAILSLLFSYIPGLNTKFAALLPEYKRLIMAGLIVVVAIIIVVLSCTGLQAYVVCQKTDLISFIWLVLVALMSNQAVYGVSPSTTSVKAIMEPKKPA